jgi:hypothetical protein
VEPSANPRKTNLTRPLVPQREDHAIVSEALAASVKLDLSGCSIGRITSMPTFASANPAMSVWQNRSHWARALELWREAKASREAVPRNNYAAVQLPQCRDCLPPSASRRGPSLS